MSGVRLLTLRPGHARCAVTRRILLPGLILLLALTGALPVGAGRALAIGTAAASTGAGVIPAASLRFWGRHAYVPDWRAARALDSVASRRFLEDYWPALHPHYRQGGTAVAADGARAADPVVFLAATHSAITPDYVPPQEGPEPARVMLRVAQGESEALSLGVRSGSAPVTIEVQVSALSDGQREIAREDLTQRLVLAYPARRRPKSPPADLAVKPMVMVVPPSGRWRFPPHTTHNYFVDVHVPLDAYPGHYVGSIEVRGDGRLLRTLPLQLQVLPFRLRVNDFHAGAFGTTYDIWEGGFTGYYPEMMEMDARYGLNMAAGFFNKGDEIPFARAATGELVVDTDHAKFAALNKTMQRLGDFGMGDVAFWNWGASGNVRQFNNVLKGAGFPGIQTDAGKRGFAEICRAIKHAERTFDWPELVINPFDEALDDQDATRDVIQAIPHIQALSPDTRLYATEWREHYARLYQSSGDVLSGGTKPDWMEYARLRISFEPPRRNFAVIGSNRAFTNSRALQDRLGGEYWHYGAASRTNPWTRYVYGFLPYSVRAEAALLWANYHGDLDGRGWTLHYVMPLRADGREARDTRGPVLASPRALLAREGIDDRKYIETLRYLAVEKSSGDDLHYLAELQDRVREMATGGTVGGRANREAKMVRAQAMDTVRTELQNRIIALLAQAAT